MRTDLKLVYSELADISRRIHDYKQALTEVKASLTSLKEFLENQESETLMKEVTQTLCESAGNKQDWMGGSFKWSMAPLALGASNATIQIKSLQSALGPSK